MYDPDKPEDQEEREAHYSYSQWVLYTIFRARKDHSLEEISERISVPYSTMKKYAIGRMACPVDVLKKIYLATRHPLIKELLEPEGYELNPRGPVGVCKLVTVDQRIIEAYAKITDLQRAFAKAYEDGLIDSQDYQDIKVKSGNAKLAIDDIAEGIGELLGSDTSEVKSSPSSLVQMRGGRK